MENNIKKTIDDIDVPLEKLDRVIEKGMQIKKKKRKNPIVMAMISVIATGALVIGSGFISPQIAKVLADVPLIGFMYDIEEHDKGLYIALSDDHKVQLNETVTSNGISITIEEIVYDGARLNVIFSMPKYLDVSPLTILVDGKEVNSGGSLRTLEEEGIYRGLWEIRIDEELPDAFDLTIKIQEIDRTRGEWVFSTPIQKVDNNNITLAAGQIGKVAGVSFTIESVETSTTTTSLKVTFDSAMEKLFSVEGFVHAAITDQDGAPLKVISQSGGGDDEKTTYTYLLEPLNNNISELKVFYYFVPNPKRKEILVPLADTFPQRIPQGKMGDIVITEVEYKGAEATLSLYVDSDFPFDDSLTPIFFEIKNDKGESLITDYIHATGPNEYQLTFQADAGKLNIHTLAIPNMEVEQTAIVTIPIK